ncbi:MAG: ribonuclease E/G, partial [Planctomycetota bacterium]
EEEIEKIYSRRVEMPSGGSLIIDQTEALVAIDVNSGRFRKHSNAETTATKMNLEAAKEVARQLRLRDMGGLIVIDFIDMREPKNRRAVERALRDAIKADRAKTKVLRISALGIVEMTRQRLKPSLKQSIYRRCEHCEGMGLIKSEESLSLLVMRDLQRAAVRDDVVKVEVRMPPRAANHLTNYHRHQIAELEGRTDKTILIVGDEELSGQDVKITCTNSRGAQVNYLSPEKGKDQDEKTPPKTVAIDEYRKEHPEKKPARAPVEAAEQPEETEEKAGKKKRRRGRRKSKAEPAPEPAPEAADGEVEEMVEAVHQARAQETPDESAQSAQAKETPAEDIQPEQPEQPEQPKKKRRRRRRRRKKTTAEQPAPEQQTAPEAQPEPAPQQPTAPRPAKEESPQPAPAPAAGGWRPKLRVKTPLVQAKKPALTVRAGNQQPAGRHDRQPTPTRTELPASQAQGDGGNGQPAPSMPERQPQAQADQDHQKPRSKQRRRPRQSKPAPAERTPERSDQE